MRYEILGSLRVISEGTEHSLTAPKTELLLGTLLVRADQVIPSGQLANELWNGNPPRRADAGLYVHISQLRRFLDQLTGPDTGPNPVVTRSPGYLLRLGEDELDLQEFEAAVADGRDQLRRGFPWAASLAFERALSLRRGPVLGGLAGGGPALTTLDTWVEEARLECIELLVEAKLRLGRHRELVSQLTSLIDEYPLREAFYQYLMLALYHCDRQAEALQIFRRARRTMVDEVGVEPCRALRRLHEAILADSVPDYPVAV